MSDKKLSGKEIARILDESYCGINTIKYRKRWENGDNRKRYIKWILNNFPTTYGVAERLVEYVNNYSEWYGYYAK